VDTDLDTLATALFVKTDDLLKSSLQLAPRRPTVRRRRNSARVNARQLPAAVGEQVNRVPAGVGAPRPPVLGGMCGLAGK
jgi:hypothetical protein